MNSTPQVAVIVGGGAAGFFAAANLSQVSQLAVHLFDSSRNFLAKVAVSGGGRCNVTHQCFNVSELVKGYPRGGKELRGAFTRFQPEDTIKWFGERGVEIVGEDDGRMFPVSNSSETIIECLTRSASSASTHLIPGVGVRAASRTADKFQVDLSDGGTIRADYLMLATGSSKAGYQLARSLGHSVTECAPSLFTFKCSDERIKDLSGISFPSCSLELEVLTRPGTSPVRFKQSGPVLITHWGLSGPAVLKLSAFAARELCASRYEAKLFINWISISSDAAKAELESLRRRESKKLAFAHPQFGLARRFWESVLKHSDFPERINFGTLSNDHIDCLVQAITRCCLAIEGKGQFKEEFVTCGGVNLREVDFRNFESKIAPNLFFAGEIIDIDGITGGFNFQAAWTGGWTVAESIKGRCGRSS